MNKKIVLLFIASLIMILISVFIGTSFLENWSNKEILLSIRLPRVLSAFFVGASLGLCGSLLQSLLQNPLAEPYTLGISGGASLGLSLSLLFSISPLWLTSPIMSGIGCLITSGIVFYLANKLGKWNQKSLILSGILISFLTSSLTFVMLSILNPYDLQQAITWLIGSFGHERDYWWPMQAISFSLLFIYTIYNHKKIDLFLLGEEISQSFIKKTKSFRFQILVFASLVIAVSVSICGMIAFLGILAPHLAMLFMNSLRTKYLAYSASLIGGILLVFSDLLTKFLYQWIYLPSGIFIAIVGGPFMVYFLLRESAYAKME